MSYDLYFCRRGTDDLPFDNVVGWSRRYAPFRKSADNQLFYENEDTGVYFSIEYSAPGDRSELDIPADVFDTGLSFNLNYVRPSFFASEAMPIAEALARQFDLVMVDPQRDPSIGSFTGEQLVESWSKSNQWAVGEMASKDTANLFYLPLEAGIEFWTYMRNYPRLTEDLREPDVFVPKYFLLAASESQRVQTAIVWTCGIHLVIPRTDLIVVMYPKSFFRRENEMVCFKSESVLGSMAGLVRDYDVSRRVRILPPENLKKADRVLRNLEGGVKLGEYTRISPDRCVDVPFGQFKPI